MKIIIASTMEPFVNGGANLFVEWLKIKLNEYGHNALLWKIPFSLNYKNIMQQMVGLRLYHLEEQCERLIAVRTPSYLLKHPDKYVWFIHHYREMYDLWDSEFNGLPKTEEVKAVRKYVMRADDNALREAKCIYTNSQEISNRLLQYNKIHTKPIYPPLLQPENFYCNNYGNYIYYASRINGHKRQLLAIQAMAYVKTDVKLLVTGKCENKSMEKDITQYIQEHELADKVTIINDWIPETEKAKYYSECLAAIYIPYMEDSYGYPSLEAHHSQKAVISCKDSGGTKELIKDGYNGFLVDSDPEKLAEVFDRLYEDRKLAETMGLNACNRIKELDISWDNVIGRFTGENSDCQ